MCILTTASNHHPGHDESQGFTLLEVMISVSIIALIFLSVFRMQSGTIELASAAKFNGMAPVLARKLLAKIDQDLAGWSEISGDFGENFPGIEWACTITDSSLDALDFISQANQNRFKRIEIEIIGLSGQKSYKVETWRMSADE